MAMLCYSHCFTITSPVQHKPVNVSTSCRELPNIKGDLLNHLTVTKTHSLAVYGETWVLLQIKRGPVGAGGLMHRTRETHPSIPGPKI